MFRAVKNLHEDYGIRYIMFCDDTFALDRGRVGAFCDAMQSPAKRPLWSCDASEADYEALNGMNFVIPARHLSIAELEREYDRTIRYFFAKFRASANREDMHAC